MLCWVRTDVPMKMSESSRVQDKKPVVNNNQITQNVKDLFRSPEIQNILDTTDFILILNQAGDDARILADHLDISKDEMAYIKTGEPGKGLLFAGNTKIPFKDEFPEETLCYKIMTTKPGESIA